LHKTVKIDKQLLIHLIQWDSTQKNRCYSH